MLETVTRASRQWKLRKVEKSRVGGSCCTSVRKCDCEWRCWSNVGEALTISHRHVVSSRTRVRIAHVGGRVIGDGMGNVGSWGWQSGGHIQDGPPAPSFLATFVGATKAPGR